MINKILLPTTTGVIEWYNTVDITADDKNVLNVSENISREFLEYADDLDESARTELDNETNALLFSFDAPYFDSDSNSYTTRPLVFIIKENKIYTFTDDERDYAQINHVLQRSMQSNTYDSLYHTLFSVLYNFSLMYHEKLRILHKERENIQKTFRKNADNNEIYRLMNVETGLVYLVTSLKGNKLALSTLKRRWDYRNANFSDKENEQLDDTLVEITQAIEVAEINMTLVEKEKNTYSTIIDNNLNSTMRLLTIITALLTIPSIIFSFFGINTPIPWQNEDMGWIYTILVALFSSGVMAFAFWKMKLFK